MTWELLRQEIDRFTAEQERQQPVNQAAQQREKVNQGTQRQGRSGNGNGNSQE